MSNLIEYISQQESLFLPVLSDNTVSWEKEKQFAIQILGSNDYLSKLANKNITSLQNAIINIASIGISLNPALQHAYLVPRKGAVCLDISYRGLLHLAMDTGSIEFGQSKIVYEKDTYINNGVDKAPTHQFNAFGDRGAPIGCYCTVRTSTGAYLTEEMDKEQILAIKARSESVKSGSFSPWKSDELEMWRKTVVKRGSKYWPKVERLNSAIHYLNETNEEGVNPEPVKDISVITEETATMLLDLTEKKGRTEADLCKWASSQFGRAITKISDLLVSELKTTENMVKNA